MVSKEYGIDPAIITYFSPLRLAGHWVVRAYFIVGFVISVLFMSSYTAAFCALLLLSGCIHIFLLVVFNRQHTQPVLYYALLSLSGAVLLFKLPLIWYALIPFTLGEFVLYRWHKQSKKIYNRWVKGITDHLHAVYWPRFQGSVSELVWFCTLHIATTESIARPKFSRLLEGPYFTIRKPPYISSGIMQVKANRLLSDLESMQKGTKIITAITNDLPAQLKTDKDKLTYIAKEYNGSYNYRHYLFATYPGFLDAWQSIRRDNF